MWQRWKQVMAEWWYDRPHPEGQLIGSRYTIVRTLGLGSYGISYLVIDKLNDEQRVLKQVRPSRLGSAKGRPLFEYEVNILRTLTHPRMPKVYDAFEENGQLYYVMTYMQGKTLEDLLFEEKRTFTEKQSLGVLLEILSLARYLHERGIIHRDIRIPNVIWREDRVYLIDFGLARRLGDSPSYIKNFDDDYHIEKQVKREVHPRSDLYALGHFLLFMLYTTYEEDGSEDKGWEEELEISPATRRILRRMLQIDIPYETADELEQDIRKQLTSLS